MQDILAAIRSWLSTQKVEGVELTELAVVPRTRDDATPDPAPIGAVQLRCWIGYEDHRQARTLVARLIDELVWIDARRIRLVPMAAQQQFFTTLEFWCFDPAKVFGSQLAGRSLTQEAQTQPPQVLRDELAGQLFAALNAYRDGLAEFGAELQSLLEDYLAPKFYTSEQADIDRFLSHLKPDTRELVEDCRMMSHLAHRQLNILEELDDWAHRDRRSASGTIQGMCLSCDSWGSGHHDRTRTCLDAISASTAQAGVEASTAVDVDELVRTIRASGSPRHQIQAAFGELARQARSEAIESHLIRLCSWLPVQSDCLRLLPGIAAAWPLAETLIFTTDTDRLTRTLAELDEYGREFTDPAQAWERAAKPKRDPRLRLDLGEINQSTLLDGLAHNPQVDAAFLARLATELGNERRPNGWLSSGLTVLQWHEAPQLHSVARILSRHPSSTVSDWARMTCESLLHLEQRRSEPHAEQVDADVVGEFESSTYHQRMAMWRKPGYAWWRYQRDGHRSPAWDTAIERAHAAYDAEVEVQDPAVRDNLQAAIDAGCKDAMAFYRLAIAATCDGDLADGRQWFAESISLFDRYPANPYCAAACEYLGAWHQAEGRREQARDLYRRAVSSGPCEYQTELKIDTLSSEIDALQAVVRPALRLGALRPFPSRTHPAAVTSIGISPDGSHAISADASGLVQVSFVGRGDFPRLIPLDGWQVSSPGRTTALWLDAETLLAAGADGELCGASFAADQLHGFASTRALGAAVLTMCLLPGGGIAVALANGAIYRWDSASDALEPLERLGRQPIVEFRCQALDPKQDTDQQQGTALLGRSETGELELWVLNNTGPGSHAIWHRPHEGYPLAFAEFVDAESILLGNTEGHGWRLHAPTGRTAQMQTLPMDPAAIVARFDFARQMVLWGNPSGSIHIESDQPGLGHIIVHDSLACLDVSFAHGLLVHAGTDHTLGCHTFNNQAFNNQISATD